MTVDSLRELLKRCLKGHAPVARDGLYFSDIEAEILAEGLLIHLDLNDYELRERPASARAQERSQAS